MKICPNAISQEPEEPQKSMTYQNACTKGKEFISGKGFGPIQKDFCWFYLIGDFGLKTFKDILLLCLNPQIIHMNIGIHSGHCGRSL